MTGRLQQEAQLHRSSWNVARVNPKRPIRSLICEFLVHDPFSEIPYTGPLPHTHRLSWFTLIRCLCLLFITVEANNRIDTEQVLSICLSPSGVYSLGPNTTQWKSLQSATVPHQNLRNIAFIWSKTVKETQILTGFNSKFASANRIVRTKN